MTKGKMPVFIQALYGTIMGVGFYKIIQPGTEKLVLYLPGHSELLTNPGVFKIFLFAVTLSIAAHDWFSYHNNRFNGEGDASGFFRHLPQVFALFFLAEMFVAAEAGTTQYWFIFGFWYSVCNLIEYFVFKHFQPAFKDNKGWQNARYKILLHLGLSGGGFILTDNTVRWQNSFSILLVFLVVLVIWIVEFRKSKKEGEKAMDLQSQFYSRYASYRGTVAELFQGLLKKLPVAPATPADQNAATTSTETAGTKTATSVSTPTGLDLSDLLRDEQAQTTHFKTIDDTLAKIKTSMDKWKEKAEA